MSLMNSIKQRTAGIYKERRQAAEKQYDDARARFLAEHPELAEPYQALMHAGYGQMIAVAQNAELISEAEKARRKEEARRRYADAHSHWEEQLRLLEERGFRAPVLHFACVNCEDKGRTEAGLCPECYPETLREAIRSLDIPYLPDPAQDFAHFERELFSSEVVQVGGGRTSAAKQMDENLKRMDDFVEHFPAQTDNYYFYGKTGTGKTYLASCAANALLDKGYVALLLNMMQFEELVSRLRTLQNSFGVKTDQLLPLEEKYELLLEADLLVLDEFGLRPGLLNRPEAELMMLFHERLSRGKAMILTSNLSPKDLQSHYDERIQSRVLEKFKMRFFFGEDLRLQTGRK